MPYFGGFFAIKVGESPFIVQKSKGFYARWPLILWHSLGEYVLLIWGLRVVKLVFKTCSPQAKLKTRTCHQRFLVSQFLACLRSSAFLQGSVGCTPRGSCNNMLLRRVLSIANKIYHSETTLGPGKGIPKNRRLANRNFVNRVPRTLGQRAENGVFRAALQGTVSNHPFQITITSLPEDVVFPRFWQSSVNFRHEILLKSEEDKTCNNVQNGLVFFFLFSLILFSCLWTKTAVKPSILRKSLGGKILKNSEKVWKCV